MARTTNSLTKTTSIAGANKASRIKRIIHGIFSDSLAFVTYRLLSVSKSDECDPVCGMLAFECDFHGV